MLAMCFVVCMDLRRIHSSDKILAALFSQNSFTLSVATVNLSTDITIISFHDVKVGAHNQLWYADWRLIGSSTFVFKEQQVVPE